MSRGILVDISAAVNQGAGIGRYARELTARLIPLLDLETTRLWYAPEEPVYDPKLPDRSPWSTLPVRRSPISRLNVDRLFARQNLPFLRFLRLGKPDDIYSPDFTAPAPRHARTHITVHDLAWLHLEADTPEPLARFLRPVVERAVHLATTVFTVSSVVRREIIETFGLPPERVVVAPNAAAAHFFTASRLSDESLTALGLQRPFLLSVGTIEPRKDLSTLFRAMADLPPSIRLAVVGRAGWAAKSVLKQIEELGLAGRVVQLGYLPDDVLPNLMTTAEALVYPSRYEGFGLPVIEALATGTPVVATDLPVFREVGGDAVDYFEAANPSSLSNAIEAVLSKLDDRDNRVARIRRARQFDWQTSAEIVARRLEGAS